jgi:hypothetical protein
VAAGTGVDAGTKQCTHETKNGLEMHMADNSGGIGVMGVLVGALIVIVVGGGLLFATGTIGSKSSTVKIELPKVTTGVK